MKVVMIDGSPRKRANTTGLLNVFEKELSAGIAVDRIRIADYNFSYCNGCLSCEKTNRCTSRDDMDSLLPRLETADAMVLGTPVYFGSVSGVLKNFMDRTNPLYWERRLSDKCACWIAIQGKSAGNTAEHAILEFFRLHGLIIVGGALCDGKEPGEALANEDNLIAVKKLAGKLNRLLTK